MRRFADQEYTRTKKFMTAMAERLRADFEYSPVGQQRGGFFFLFAALHCKRPENFLFDIKVIR